MTNPICGGPALPPDPSPLWSVPPGMVAPPLPRPDDAGAVERMARAMCDEDGSAQYSLEYWERLARAALLALWEGAA